MNDIRKEYQRLQLFERVCMLCSGELQQFIFTLTRHDRFAMEEIYQNTMLGALRGLHYLRDCSRMKAWIFAIARAEARRYYAEILLKNNVLYYAEGEDRSGYFIDFTKLVEDREAVQILISSLTDVERKLCEMHYFEGHSFKEISELLDLNYNTIRSMHIRGMAKMKNVCMKKNKEKT